MSRTKAVGKCLAVLLSLMGVGCAFAQSTYSVKGFHLGMSKGEVLHAYPSTRCVTASGEVAARVAVDEVCFVGLPTSFTVGDELLKSLFVEISKGKVVHATFEFKSCEAARNALVHVEVKYGEPAKTQTENGVETAFWSGEQDSMAMRISVDPANCTEANLSLVDMRPDL